MRKILTVMMALFALAGTAQAKHWTAEEKELRRYLSRLLASRTRIQAILDSGEFQGKPLAEAKRLEARQIIVDTENAFLDGREVLCRLHPDVSEVGLDGIEHTCEVNKQ